MINERSSHDDCDSRDLLDLAIALRATDDAIDSIVAPILDDNFSLHPLALALNQHRLTRPLALLLHRAMHLHAADDDCPRCADDLR